MTVAELNPLLKAPPTSVAFRHILVASDFSEPSRLALCEALALAPEHLSVVHVLHPDLQYSALESPPELDLKRIAAERQLKALTEKWGAVQKIDSTVVKRGPVAEQVVSVIQEKAIDLLVIGTRGRGGFRKLALGSVAEELLRLAPCPVMTIGPEVESAAFSRGVGFHRILFATDFGKGSAKALPVALALARAQQAKLILLHMIPPIPSASANLCAYAPTTAAADEVEKWDGTYRKQALKQLKEWLPAETGLEHEPEYVVGSDFLAEGVLSATAKFAVELIVMGANRTPSPKMAAHIPWTAVHEVIRHAPCPVLTVAG